MAAKWKLIIPDMAGKIKVEEEYHNELMETCTLLLKEEDVKMENINIKGKIFFGFPSFK